MKTFSLNISYIHQFSYILTFPPYKEANDVILKQTDTPPPLSLHRPLIKTTLKKPSLITVKFNI